MSDSPSNTEATPEPAGETSADTPPEAVPTEPTSEQVDWQARFEAQQKVNRDLEKKVRSEAGTLKSQLEALQAKFDGKEAEYNAEQAKRETERAALAKANERILKAEIRAAAANTVQPDMLDALPGLIDLSSFEVGDDGEVDASAIASAVADLISQRPSLAVKDGKRFQGTADAGARNDAAGPAQLTREDMKRMSSEQIADAEAKGQFDDVLGRK